MLLLVVKRGENTILSLIGHKLKKKKVILQCFQTKMRIGISSYSNITFKIAFMKVLHFLADIYKYTSFLDDILNKRDNLFTPKSCQVIPLTHFAKSQRHQADLMPLQLSWLPHLASSELLWQADACPAYCSS